MKRVMGLEFICLLNLFMSLFDCTETIGPTHPKPPARVPARAGENHSSANGNGRPFSNLVLFCAVLVMAWHCPLPSPAGNQRLSKQLNQQQPLQISTPEACPVCLSASWKCVIFGINCFGEQNFAAASRLRIIVVSSCNCLQRATCHAPLTS